MLIFAGRSDLSRSSFLVVCLLAHGERHSNVDHLVGVDGEPVDIMKRIVAPVMANRSLDDKLKLFVIQACRKKGDQPVASTSSLESSLSVRDPLL